MSNDRFSAVEGESGEENDLSAPKTSKGRRSKERIKQAARTIFARDGYLGSRVTDIADEAGFSSGAYYRYYDGKRDVFEDLIDDLLADLLNFSYAPWNRDDPGDSIRLTTERYLDLYEENADLLKLLIEVAQTDDGVAEAWGRGRETFFDRIEGMLDRARHDGLVHEKIDIPLVAALMGGMTEHYAYLVHVLGIELSDDPSAAAEQITGLWVRGIFA